MKIYTFLLLTIVLIAFINSFKSNSINKTKFKRNNKINNLSILKSFKKNCEDYINCVKTADTLLDVMHREFNRLYETLFIDYYKVNKKDFVKNIKTSQLQGIVDIIKTLDFEKTNSELEKYGMIIDQIDNNPSLSFYIYSDFFFYYIFKWNNTTSNFKQFVENKLKIKYKDDKDLYEENKMYLDKIMIIICKVNKVMQLNYNDKISNNSTIYRGASICLNNIIRLNFINNKNNNNSYYISFTPLSFSYGKDIALEFLPIKDNFKSILFVINHSCCKGKNMGSNEFSISSFEKEFLVKPLSLLKISKIKTDLVYIKKNKQKVVYDKVYLECVSFKRIKDIKKELNYDNFLV